METSPGWQNQPGFVFADASFGASVVQLQNREKTIPGLERAKAGDAEMRCAASCFGDHLLDELDELVRSCRARVINFVDKAGDNFLRMRSGDEKTHGCLRLQILDKGFCDKGTGAEFFGKLKT